MSESEQGVVGNFPRGRAVLLLGILATVVATCVRVMEFSLSWDRGIVRWLQTGDVLVGWPEWYFWVIGVVLAFGVPMVFLRLERQWQRVVLWFFGVFVMLGAVPVMQLWGVEPTLAIPFLVLVVSGLGSLVFAGSVERELGGGQG